MDKPEDIAQWAWDEAKASTEQYGYNDGDERIVSSVARAILSAQSNAYIDAARIAEDYDGDGLSGGYDAHLGDAYLTKREISAAILSRKDEVGRN